MVYRQLFLYSPWNKCRTAPASPGFFRGVLNSFVKLEPNEQILGFHAKNFIIASEEEIPFTLDGENGGSYRRTEIQCCHRAIDYVWG